MDFADKQPTPTCHVVAMPYPGRGHINPMLNLCKAVAEKSSDIFVTFVVTEEWLGIIGSTSKPPNFRFASIPNVVPSESVRAEDILGFVMAVLTNMEEPFELLLDQLRLQPAVIIADAVMPWTADVAGRRNIPLAYLWTMSASVYSMFYHFDLLVQNGHFPVQLSGSFLSVSSEQMNEIAAGLNKSGVRYLWVARNIETKPVLEICGEKGLIVSWCDQLSVLCHPSVGGFWSHCGWNSTKEAVLTGVPLLTFPVLMDQLPNAKAIVEDWRTGWRVKREIDKENLARCDDIAELVQRFMNLENPERKELTRNARELQKICEREFADGQSFQTNLDEFTKSILQHTPCAL